MGTTSLGSEVSRLQQHAVRHGHTPELVIVDLHLVKHYDALQSRESLGAMRERGVRGQPWVSGGNLKRRECSERQQPKDTKSKSAACVVSPNQAVSPVRTHRQAF